MRMTRGICIAAALLASVGARAETIKARVSAGSGPWDVRANRNMMFGRGDEKKPTVVPIFTIPAGSKVTILADGSIAYRPDGRQFGPDGDPRYDTSARTGNAGGFPSQYARGGASAIQLMGAFVNGDGTVVGEPFLIGSKTEVEVPKGAVAITLGVNDETYADNEGYLAVTLKTVKGKVTVE